MATASPAACLNCGATLHGPFCSRCGQKVVRRDISLGGFLRETTEQLTDWDGKVPLTLRTLFLRPGVLTLDFLAGRRARWLSPLRVYLICSLSFFAGRAVIDELGLRAFRDMARFSLDRPEGVTGPLTTEERKLIADGLPGQVFGAERVERIVFSQRAFNQELEKSLPRAMFVLLPVFALLTRLAWAKALPRYPAHLYVALHIHAAAFGAMLVMSLVVGIVPQSVAAVIGPGFLVYIVWYSLTALRRVFADSWPKTLAKSVAIVSVYFVCFVTVAIFLLALALRKF
jgi:Protein of unknown function (DUF3667)